MFNDQDGCEWVNVSSGIGLPGQSRKRAVKRFCVCECRVTRVCPPIALLTADVTCLMNGHSRCTWTCACPCSMCGHALMQM